MMLVLSRYCGSGPGTAVYLDFPGGVRVTLRVLSGSGGKVRLGIEAPASVTVCRDDAKEVSPYATAPAPIRRDD